MKNKKLPICGEQCPDCVYIGNGGFMCLKCSTMDEAVIVLTDFSCLTNDYLKCMEITMKELQEKKDD